MLWAVPRCLISVRSLDPALGAACAASPVNLSRTRCFLHGLQIVGSNHQLPLTPEVRVALYHYGSLNRHHLQPQTPQRRTLKLNTSCCCSHTLRNSHTPLPVTAKCSGHLINLPKGPTTRSSLCHLPAGPYCQEPSIQTLTLPIASFSLETHSAPCR